MYKWYNSNILVIEYVRCTTLVFPASVVDERRFCNINENALLNPLGWATSQLACSQGFGLDWNLGQGVAACWIRNVRCDLCPLCSAAWWTVSAGVSTSVSTAIHYSLSARRRSRSHHRRVELIRRRTRGWNETAGRQMCTTSCLTPLGIYLNHLLTAPNPAFNPNPSSKNKWSKLVMFFHISIPYTQPININLVFFQNNFRY